MRPDWMDEVGYYCVYVFDFLFQHWPAFAAALAGLLAAALAGLPGGVALAAALALTGAGYVFERAFLPPAPALPGAAPQPQPQQVQAAQGQAAQAQGQGQGYTAQVPLPPGVEFYPPREPDMQAFDRVIGLERAKEALADALAAVIDPAVREKYARYRIKPPKGVLLYGTPGTGKTSFARAAAERFGCAFYVVNASSITGSYVGQTEGNIRALFAHARNNTPSIVFFDEIDAIGRKRGQQAVNSPSDLALNVLLAELDGFTRAEGVFVIAATNRLDVLDEALIRPGRFDTKIEVGLPDQKARRALLELYLKDRPHTLQEKDFSRLAAMAEGLSPAGIRAAVEQVALAAAKAGAEITASGLEAAVREVSGRGAQVKARDVEAVWKDIEALIGLAPVKNFLKEVEAVVKTDQIRREKGLPPLRQSLHMCFLGNPGTGKTTVARLVGELFAALGALPSGHLVEVDRSGLVAGYIGQTALKVQEVVEKALGGVLFVDEAYSLARGGEQDFGREALDTLIKAMEDRRDKLCIILAGYTEEMQELFKLNPGLGSRIGFTVEFPDYSAGELVQIARLEAKKQGFALAPGAEAALLTHFNQVDPGSAGNGRYARGVVEAAIRRAVMAGRVDTLEAEDFTF